VRVLAHRPAEELDDRAVALELLDEERLVDEVAGEPVRRGDEDPVQLGTGRSVPQPVEAGSPERGAAVAVVAEDVV
jgi:hypothetical protein